MLVLMIAEHNRLRSDGGVTHMVLKRIGPAPDGESRALLQITPKMAGYDIVISIDSNTIVQDQILEPLDELPAPPALTYAATPAEIIELSRALFGFKGRAFLCRVPVDDLPSGEGRSQPAGLASHWRVGESSRRSAYRVSATSGHEKTDGDASVGAGKPPSVRRRRGGSCDPALAARSDCPYASSADGRWNAAIKFNSPYLRV